MAVQADREGRHEAPFEGTYEGASAGAYEGAYEDRSAGGAYEGTPESVHESTPESAHDGGRPCDTCPHGAREKHRKAVAAFLALRDELASGIGLPTALAHSTGASRQWVSDELTQAAAAVAEHGRAEGEAWLRELWRRTLVVVWGTVAALLVVQAVTAVGAGWTTARTAGLTAAVLVGATLTGAAWAHRERGGLLAPLLGEDNRLSTSRAVAAAWVLFVGYAVLVLAAGLALAGTPADRDALLAGVQPARAAGLLTVLAAVCGIAVLVRRVVAVRVRGQRLQKVPADRPRAADLLTDDAGRGSFADTVYALLNAVALVFAGVRLARRPDQLPDLPWALALLTLVAALTYLAGKHAEGGRPVLLSVVRAREPGDLDAPIRTGDDIELRGAGFVPPGARTPYGLARTTVRIGAVHVHVPLVPTPGGFTNPTDTVLTVPVPAEVEAGWVEVLVVTAAGMETNRCVIEVRD